MEQSMLCSKTTHSQMDVFIFNFISSPYRHAKEYHLQRSRGLQDQQAQQECLEELERLERQGEFQDISWQLERIS